MKKESNSDEIKNDNNNNLEDINNQSIDNNKNEENNKSQKKFKKRISYRRRNKRRKKFKKDKLNVKLDKLKKVILLLLIRLYQNKINKLINKYFDKWKKNIILQN